MLLPEYRQVNALHDVQKKRISPSIGTYHLGHDKVGMIACLRCSTTGIDPPDLQPFHRGR